MRLLRLVSSTVVLLLGVLMSSGSAFAGQEPQLSQYTLPDPYLHCTAWTFVAPTDWIKEGGVTWTGNLTPAYFTVLSVRSADNAKEYRLYPIFTFAETNQPMLANGNEMRRYSSPADCIREIIIPRCRREIANLKIVGTEEMPKLVQEGQARAQSAGVAGARVEAARVFVEYSVGGKQMEEVFYCTNAYVRGPVVPIWVIDRAFSYRAEKGKLAESFRVLGTIAESMRENPQWIQARRQQMQRIVAAMSRPPAIAAGSRGPSILDVSKSMARDQDEFLRGTDRSFQQRLNSPGLDNWSHAMRGTQTMQNPVSGEQMDVSSGYLRYYQDNLGRIIGSNDVIGDPYVDAHINATEMKPVQR